MSLKCRDILLIVKNYTGDKINFGLAAEMARTNADKNVEILVVADDVALLDTDMDIGARGIAGVVLVHKIVGAAAERGLTLQKVKEIGEKAAQLVKTYGVSLSSCTLPAASKPMFEMQENHMEIGLGIHGEKGLGSTQKTTADEIVATLLSKLSKHASFKDQSNKRLVVLLNNLGSTTQMEMAVVARAILNQLSGSGFNVVRFFQGTALTAMETVGISISILPIHSDDDILLELIDEKTTMPAWISLGSGHIDVSDCILDETSKSKGDIKSAESGELSSKEEKGARKRGFENSKMCASIASTLVDVCDMLETQADYLTKLDSQVGDGDLGTNLAIAAKSIKSRLPSWSTTHPATLFTQLAMQLDTSLGGTSGPLYSIFFLNLANYLANLSNDPTAIEWAEAAHSGALGITKLGGAKIGDRTMMDALIPAVEKLSSAGSDLAAAAQMAATGSKNTANMVAKKGRSTYLQERVIGIVDPGSAAVALILQQVADSLAKSD